MASGSSTSWPPADGLTTPSVPLKDANLTSCASAHVYAPAELVFEVVRDAAKYSEWNTWIPRVTVHSQPEGVIESSKLNIDTLFTFHVIMDANKPTKETPTRLRVNDISTPSQPSKYIPDSVLADEDTYTADLKKVYRISWKSDGGYANLGLRMERFHEIIVLGENDCEVRTWENQGGLLAHAVRWLYEQTLMDKLQLWCDCLKEYCEKKATELGNPSA